MKSPINAQTSNRSKKWNGMTKMTAALVAAAALFGSLAVVATPRVALAEPTDTAKGVANGGQDVLVLKNGTVLTGTIISESATTVRFKGKVSGIELETDYSKSEIMEIKRGVNTAPAAAPAGAAADPKSPAGKTPARAAEPSEGGPRIYWLDLDGHFGEEITQTPIRDAMNDAKKNKADIIIMALNARTTDPMSGDDAALLDQQNPDFEGMRRAEKIMPVWVSEMPVEWEGSGLKMPRLVFWVKRAMGGAAFLPLISREIYFDPDAKLGGIGNLSTMLHGHDRVVKKQISLRLQHAVGWANVGIGRIEGLDADYPEKLVRAMTKIEYVLSVKYEGGKPILLERMPESPDEELLTDDGQGPNRDTIDKLARDEGNDVLTLDANKARRLWVSKGTVASKDELIEAMGLARSGVMVKGNAAQIMNNWTKGLDNARTQIVRMWGEYRDAKVQPPADRNARHKDRTYKISKLDELKRLLTRWGEGLDVYWLYRNGIPINQEGEADLSKLTEWQDILRTEDMKDKK